MSFLALAASSFLPLAASPWRLASAAIGGSFFGSMLRRRREKRSMPCFADPDRGCCAAAGPRRPRASSGSASSRPVEQPVRPGPRAGQGGRRGLPQVRLWSVVGEQRFAGPSGACVATGWSALRWASRPSACAASPRSAGASPTSNRVRAAALRRTAGRRASAPRLSGRPAPPWRRRRSSPPDSGAGFLGGARSGPSPSTRVSGFRAGR